MATTDPVQQAPGKRLHMLALGDSYTAGTGVAIHYSWPRQLLDDWRSEGRGVELHVVAENGWRTDNLAIALEESPPGVGWDIVTLLIGVNDQYQGFNPSGFATRYRDLLATAAGLTSRGPAGVLAVSIPDYAATPEGKGDPAIGEEIDVFNAIVSEEAGAAGVSWVDVTGISRTRPGDPQWLAGDGLHPGPLQYRAWVDRAIGPAVAGLLYQN